ncbi:MAG: rpsP [Deltaproteobacteria bacterium]|nr:rpsP [Deltaproteobacteria bacterium]
MVKIRLARYGAKKKPFYRLVAADARSPRDGKFIDILGTFDPTKNPAAIKLDGDKVKMWLERGAQPTDTAGQIIKRGMVAK